MSIKTNKVEASRINKAKRKLGVLSDWVTDVKALIEVDKPILLIGEYGIGKTEVVKSLFDYTEVVRASSKTEDDIAGIADRDGDYEKRLMSPHLRRVNEQLKLGKSVCLFFDEIDKGDMRVNDTMLGVFDSSRQWGDYYLDPKVKLIAACNPPETSGRDGLSQPMLDRFLHVHCTVNVGSWLVWARERYQSEYATAIIDKVEEGHIDLLEYNTSSDGSIIRSTTPRSFAGALDIVEKYGEDAGTLLSYAVAPLTADKMIKIIAGRISSTYRHSNIPDDVGEYFKLSMTDPNTANVLGDNPTAITRQPYMVKGI